MISERTLPLESHYIYYYNSSNENYINIHIPGYVYLPLHLNNDLNFIHYKAFLNLSASVNQTLSFIYLLISYVICQIPAASQERASCWG